MDIQLNSKILQIKEEYLVGLLYHICDEDESNLIISAVNAQHTGENIVQKSSSKIETAEKIISMAKDATEILLNLKSLASPMPSFEKVILNLANTLIKGK